MATYVPVVDDAGHDRRDGGDDVEDARRVERHGGVGTQLHRHREGRCPERRRDHRQGQLQHRRRRRHGLPQSCRRCCSTPRARLVGVPLASLLHIRATYEAWKVGRKIDALLLDIIESRRRREGGGMKEVEEVTGWSGPMDAAVMGKLTKMGCMLNEVLRLYPPSPNVQRPAACDAEVVRGERRNAAWGLGISASQGREGESADTPSAAAPALTRSPLTAAMAEGEKKRER
uniref:Uncharacterized protein n=1 Tax=Oryza nivara TaxID=4536 RepID=A0A0E0G556_ORYNI